MRLTRINSPKKALETLKGVSEQKATKLLTEGDYSLPTSFSDLADRLNS